MSRAKPISMPGDKVDSAVKGAVCYHGVAGGFSHDGQHYILMAESSAALCQLLKHAFPEFEPEVEKQVDAVLVHRDDVFMEGDEL